MPRFGCDQPAATASVPLQTPHELILRVSTARHCLRFAVGVKHIFLRLHFVAKEHLRKPRSNAPRVRFARR